ncbi:hypothetical protein FRX31_017667 [Thalictrum thalictroides]|uniref:Uncharacterized protein n=1 Tax=Thalictrum thalictroides TaxID=46969 RepID=A0A7J6W8N9_THATH|nr:hypothetical protein FRX31_017667 [Thalictrum thalictroides]
MIRSPRRYPTHKKSKAGSKEKLKGPLVPERPASTPSSGRRRPLLEGESASKGFGSAVPRASRAYLFGSQNNPEEVRENI